ncbi:MAG TPA: hypothetical protein GX505_02230 [Clostridiales bacterium]|nr:hypothetical protein [Clostridiales bacterium]
MNIKKTKQKPDFIILNKYVTAERDLIRRFVKIDYPIYSLPVEFTERTSEPYEEIEKNIEKLLYYTDIDGRDSLFRTMGIDNFRQLSNHTLEYLISINHIDENNGRLSLTPLGKESLEQGTKQKVEKSARVIYFDALSLEPLPQKYYKPSEAAFLSPVDKDDFRRANIVDIWEDLPRGSIRKLLEYDGEKRLKYNIPQEMIDVKVDEKVLNYDISEIVSKGIINYIPLYAVIIDTKDGFEKKMRSSAKVEFEIYNGVSGMRDDFFEGLIKKNYDKMWYIFSALFDSYNPLTDTDGVWLWGGKLSEKASMSCFEIDNDQNLVLKIDMDNVVRWIANNDKDPLMDLAYNNLIPLSDRNQHGRMMKLVFTYDVRRKAIDYLLDQKREALKDQDLSQAYIDKQIKELEDSFLKRQR